MELPNYRLSEISLSNFKCFEHIEIPLGQLTLLTGHNAAGKSSCIQGILFLAQYFRSNYSNNIANLNGPLTKLGTVRELINEKRDSNDITIGAELRENIGDTEALAKYSFQFKHENKEVDNLLTAYNLNEYDTDVTPNTIKKTIELASKLTFLELYDNEENFSNLKELVELIRNTIYISTEREAMEDVFPTITLSDSIHADVGTDGRFASWWFDQCSDEKIDVDRLHPDESANTLRRQLNAWASSIFPDVQANTQRIEKTNLIKLELRISKFQDWKRPSNIGYGISYIFPILVAGLLAKRGQLLIVDSPEAHLHPAGQSKLGKFLATIAKTGTQVIVETHSDHFLNGVRVAVKDGVIESNQIQIHFFENRKVDDQYENKITAINLNKHGKLSGWPDGFFDQSEKDLSILT